MGRNEHDDTDDTQIRDALLAFSLLGESIFLIEEGRTFRKLLEQKFISTSLE